MDGSSIGDSIIAYAVTGFAFLVVACVAVLIMNNPKRKQQANQDVHVVDSLVKNPITAKLGGLSILIIIVSLTVFVALINYFIQ